MGSIGWWTLNSYLASGELEILHKYSWRPPQTLLVSDTVFLFLNLKLAASSIWATTYLIIPISGLWCKFLPLLPFTVLDVFFWGVGFFNSANSFTHSLCIQVPLVTTWDVLAFLLDPQCSLIRKHRTKLWSFLLFLINGGWSISSYWSLSS